MRQSYVTVQEAEDFLNQSLNNGVWLSMTPTQKQNSLFDASQLLDNLFDWNGNKSDPNQILAWPRKNVTDCEDNEVDDSTIPLEITTSVITLASNMTLGSSPLLYDQSNVTKVKVGPIDISMDSNKLASDVIPDFIKTSLRCLGTYTGPKDAMTAYNVRAIR